MLPTHNTSTIRSRYYQRLKLAEKEIEQKEKLKLSNDYHAKKRQEYIESLWEWNWQGEAIYQELVKAHKEAAGNKDKLDAANKKFIKESLQAHRNFFKEHDDNANILFGIYASSYATIMFVGRVLVGAYGLSLGMPATVAIVAIAAFNIILDKYLFDIFLKDWSLDDRETIKFLMLIVITIICVPLEVYIVPAALLLFMAGYFVNYMLQKDQLAEVIEKFFFTLDESGVPRLFEGFAKDANVKFNNWHYGFLILGCVVFSALYATAMVALAAMWIYPAIASFATLAVGLGFAASPLGIIVCIPLIIYGIIYAFLTAQAWARLIALYASLSTKEGYKNISIAKFVLLAFGLLIGKFAEGISNYFIAMKANIDKWPEKTALQIIGNVAWGTLKLTWKLIKVTLSILTFYGMYYMLDQACVAIGELVNHTKTGDALFKINYAAQFPLMAQQALNVALPDKQTAKEAAASLPWPSEMRMIFYRAINAIRTALVPNGGDLPETDRENFTVGAAASSSFVLVDPAMNNFRQADATKKRINNMYGKQIEASTAAPASNHAHVPGNAQTFG